MKTRKLIPSTIIPPELYVQREADRQLRRIINDAARPACVLVARQMGKTNLLLNAKRELEDSENAVVYIDLSIPFASDRECFRHIIDIALDAGCEAFTKCKDQILSGRNNLAIPAVKEHELELRTLLGAISGKLVIFLDEIDSLARGNFSDRVFGQIRSVYFSRVNYPQLKRLTYVLSGVLEPNEIIKDKRISPFNIAEKIYLDDFSTEEYENFLHRADLQFGEPVKGRIFEWTAGNPRITWDVCADLEDKISKGLAMTTDEVDQTVAKIYLKDFNQAPVDHIREVVSNDDELRSAVTVIKFNKGETLSDAIKNKLYLTGIISAAQNYKSVKIKNRVLESALSDQWLHDIEINKKGLSKIAEEKFGSKDYRAALELYEQYFKNAELPEDAYKRYSIYFNAGASAYHISESEKAVKYLELSKWEKDVSPAIYFDIKLMLGVSYLTMGNVGVSRKLFQEIIDHPKRDSKYFSALINLGSSYLFEEDFQTAIQIYERAISDVGAEVLDKSEASRFTAVIYVSLGNAHLGNKNGKTARDCFDKALEFCLPDQKPAVVIGLLKCQMSQAERKNLVADCVKHVLENHLRPSAPDPEKALALTHSNLLTILAAVFEFDRPSFEMLFDYAAKNKDIADTSGRLLPQLAIHSLRQRKTQIAAELAKAALSKPPQEAILSDLDELEMVRLLCMVTTGSKQKPHVKHFVELLRKGIKPTYFRYTDVGVLSDEITALSESGRVKEVEEIFTLAKSHLHKMEQDEIGTFALLHFNYLVSFVENGQRSRIKEAAEECLAFVNSLPHSNGSEILIGATGLTNIKEFAERQLRPAIQFPQASALPRKFERNEKITVKYSDGKIVPNIKFKKVESDLLNGRCVVVEEEVSKK